MYYDQRRRVIKTRYDEHLAHVKYARSEKANVIPYVSHSGHPVDKSSLKSGRSAIETAEVVTYFQNSQLSTKDLFSYHCCFFEPLLRNCYCLSEILSHSVLKNDLGLGRGTVLTTF